MALKISKKELEQRSSQEFDHLISEVNIAIVFYKVIFTKDQSPKDIELIKFNKLFANTFGLDETIHAGRTLNDLFPSLNYFWIHKLHELDGNSNEKTFSSYFDELDRYFRVQVMSDSSEMKIAIFYDISEKIIAEYKQQRLTDILHIVRSTNRLSYLETDQDSFLQQLCNSFVNLRGYRSAIIFRKVMDQDTIVYSAGFGEMRNEINRFLKDADFIACTEILDSDRDLKIINDPKITCNKCPVAKLFDGRAVVVHKLKYRRKNFGVLVIAMGKDDVHDQEEVNLIGELAKDISFALQKYTLEEKNSMADREIEVSHQRIAEQNKTLKNLNTRLKDMNEVLVQEKQKAETADIMKNIFLANMSHEIRTPLNGILGFVQLLQTCDVEKGKNKEYLSIINKSSKKLLEVLNNLLDLSKLESGSVKINHSMIDLDDLMSELLNKFSAELVLNEKEHLTINYTNHSSLKTIISDKHKIEQILINLLNNAVKFTETGEIVFGYQTVQADEILFYVKDTGIGIAEDKKTIIFEKFRQSDETNTRVFGGTGIGLTISQALIEKLKGKIWVESSVNLGTTFYFTLPISQ